MRSLIGGLPAGDRGLYVSIGSLTKESRYEADARPAGSSRSPAWGPV